jgi:hypothetical protein
LEALVIWGAPPGGAPPHSRGRHMANKKKTKAAIFKNLKKREKENKIWKKNAL